MIKMILKTTKSGKQSTVIQNNVERQQKSTQMIEKVKKLTSTL
jgi:hypothetical protein